MLLFFPRRQALQVQQRDTHTLYQMGRLCEYLGDDAEAERLYLLAVGMRSQRGAGEKNNKREEGREAKGRDGKGREKKERLANGRERKGRGGKGRGWMGRELR